MKKFFKVLIIIIVAVVVAVGLYWGFFYLSEKVRDSKLDNERINGSTTLSKYIEYHDTEHTRDIETSLDFYAEDIQCDLLKDRNILYYNGDILVLDDYTIYETAFNSDKIYSNGQQCKKIETDIKIKGLQIQTGTLYLIGEDNKYYRIETGQKTLKEINQREDATAYFFVENANIKMIRPIYKQSNTGTNINAYIVLKNDGQIYEQEYERKHNSTTNETKTIMINENLLYSNKDYGYIRDFFYFYGGEGNKDNKITKIVSDKGLFYIKQTNDQQYIDTEPTYEMVASDIYNKYKADIKYINGNYIFTTDNNIIETDMLCRDIDKEVK